MKNITLASIFAFACILASPAAAQTIAISACTASTLNGTYSLTLSGRGISAAGSFTGSLQGVGTATFDGTSKVTLSGIDNTNLATGKAFTYSGTYTLPSNCYGTVTLTQGSTATFTLLAWNSGAQFELTGADSTYTYSGSGSNTIPVCATATLSGPYTFDATGFTLTGTAQTGSGDESGVLQFDGQGNMTAAYTYSTSGAAATSLTGTGTYSVASNCIGTGTLTDSAGKVNTLNFVLVGAYGQNVNVLAANSSFVRQGSAHSAFTNPTQSIANVASYAVNATPPGSVFYLGGINLATKPGYPSNVPLPTVLSNTSVTVNGELAPLFYVDSGQIDAQMPWDIPGNTVATVIVKSGSSTSNAAAVYVPANATPGISVFPTNRAVVVNKDNVTVNTASTPAAIGDEVVVYFTGGGPVQTTAKLVSGVGSPPNLQVSGASPTITVGGMNATIDYIGLTAGAIGLYQANFNVPQLAKGTYPVVITIGGVASNSLGGPNPNPVMSVSN